MDWLLLLTLMGVICMVAMIPMMMWGSHRWRWWSGVWGPGRDDLPETPRQILDRRYATGELTKERYQDMRVDLDTRAGAE